MRKYLLNITNMMKHLMMKTAQLSNSCMMILHCYCKFQLHTLGRMRRLRCCMYRPSMLCSSKHLIASNSPQRSLCMCLMLRYYCKFHLSMQCKLMHLIMNNFLQCNHHMCLWW